MGLVAASYLLMAMVECPNDGADLFADQFALIRPGLIRHNGKEKPLNTQIICIVRYGIDA